MASMTRDEFQTMLRALSAESVRLRLTTPVLRDNPQIPSANRTLRKTLAGQLVLRVNRWRPAIDVASDLIDGIVKANDLDDEEAEPIRSALWQAAGLAVSGASV